MPSTHHVRHCNLSPTKPHYTHTTHHPTHPSYRLTRHPEHAQPPLQNHPFPPLPPLIPSHYSPPLIPSYHLFPPLPTTSTSNFLLPPTYPSLPPQTRASPAPAIYVHLPYTHATTNPPRNCLLLSAFHLRRGGNVDPLPTTAPAPAGDRSTCPPPSNHPLAPCSPEP